jgi:hypothetical protein
MDPIARFCEMFADFTPDDGDEFIAMAAFGLGCPDRPTDVEVTPSTKMGELYYPDTIEDLRKQLNRIVATTNVQPQVLITGTLLFLLSHYEKLADPKYTSESIDKFLEMKEQLEAELKIPVEQRRGNRTDDRIHKMIASVQKVLSTTPSGRMSGERRSSSLRQAWGRWFPESYWDEVNRYWLQMNASRKDTVF